MMKYKINVLMELEKAGYPQIRLRNEKLIGQAAIQKLRQGKMIGMNVLTTICKLLNKQPGDIIEYVMEE